LRTCSTTFGVAPLETMKSMSGLEFLRSIADGRLPAPPIAQTLGFHIAEVSQGLQFAFPVHFAFNDATVRTEDAAALDRFANIVSKHYTGAKVTVEGFTDPAGSNRYNAALSKQRADAVKAYVSSKGLDASLINSVGYGESRQVNQGAWGDQPGAELNRRVVFVIETPANADANRVTASVQQ